MVCLELLTARRSRSTSRSSNESNARSVTDTFGTDVWEPNIRSGLRPARLQLEPTEQTGRQACTTPDLRL